jgi:hypothetical protein
MPWLSSFNRAVTLTRQFAGTGHFGPANEIRAMRIAQFSGPKQAPKVGETSITGFVQSVREVKSAATPSWIVAVIRREASGQLIKRNLSLIAATSPSQISNSYR